MKKFLVEEVKRKIHFKNKFFIAEMEKSCQIAELVAELYYNNSLKLDSRDVVSS